MAFMWWWLIYLALLSALAIGERLITPEGVGLDRIIDIAILIVTSVGALTLWILSVPYTERHIAARSYALPAIRILIACTAAPVVGACIATYVAHDIDGGFLLLFVPIFSSLFACIVLPMHIQKTKTRRPNHQKEEETL